MYTSRACQANLDNKSGFLLGTMHFSCISKYLFLEYKIISYLLCVDAVVPS